MSAVIDTPTPVVERITTNSNGLAGQIAYTAHVRYGTEVQYVSFASSRYGGPVVMVTENMPAVFVTEPERFGRLSPRWVRRFYGQEV